MEENKNIIITNQTNSNEQENNINKIPQPHHIQHNSFSNTNYTNNDFSLNINKKENEENQINSNLSTSFKSSQDFEIQIELDKNKNNKKVASNNNNYLNNYSKSPSHRNNKNINNHININKVVKPFFTHKSILLNKHSLKEVNECIYKDYNQLANILPYYQNYYFQNKINNSYNNYNNYRNNNFNNNNINNNNDAVLICLKYIEFSNFFFNNNVTYKVQNLLFNIINGDRRILEQNKYTFLKNKLNEVYNKLIPYHIRCNYLKAYFDRNPDKNLYYLFKKDLDKLSMSKHIDKKILNYLYEIFEIVKQRMEIKKDNIKIYINKLYNNGINNYSININSNKNGGNYNNIENLNNINNELDLNNNDNNSFNPRRYSFQYSSGQNNNISNYKNINNNRINYMNGSNRKNNDINNKEVSQFNINNYNNKVNNYKSNNINRSYYYKNIHKVFNNNDRDYRNKNNKNNTFYKGELVEIEDVNNNSNFENEDKTQENNKQDNNEINEDEYKNIITNNDREKNGNNLWNNNNENMNVNLNNIEIKDINNNNENNELNNDINNKNDNEKKINDTTSDITNLNGKIDDKNIYDESNSNNKNNNIENLEENILDTNEINKLQNNNNNTNNININNETKINGNENNNSENHILNNNIHKLQIDDNINNIKIEEKTNNIDPDINGQYENENEDNFDNEENLNNDINYDFLYNEEENKNNENNYKSNNNNDKNFPKITFNDFNSSNNSLNINTNNSNNLVENISNNIINTNMNNNNNSNNSNNQNNNNSNMTNSINVNNIINNNNYNNINLINGVPNININNINQTLKEIFNIQSSLISKINNYLPQLNQIKSLGNNQNSLYNNYYFLNMYNLGISNLIYNSNLYNFHNNKNYHNNPFTTVKQDYNKLKKLEKENPQEIKDKLDLFENNILLPIYNEISTNNNNQEIISKYSKVFSKYKEAIELILNKNNLEGTIVEPYGSIVNNFLTNDGDIDISIVPKNKSKDEFFKYLQEIEEDLIKIRKYAIENNSIYINSRYTLLSITDIETKINIDITVHNLLPINNSKMIRLYSLFDQRFHILGIFLKHWVKINNIKGAPNGYLSSYALILLIIHFLQNIVEPKILPVLQEIKNEPKKYIYRNGEKELTTNLYFEEDFDKMKEYMNIINCGKENNSTVTELLVQFFEYYAYKYNTNNNRYLITIKHSDKKSAINCDQIVFPIEDPFDIEHNPGKSMKFNSQQFPNFIFCMQKEINNILSGEYFKYNNY